MKSPQRRARVTPAPSIVPLIVPQRVPEPGFGSSGVRALVLSLVLFAVSGFAALIYEVVWFQFLELIIGSSAISTAVLLATFMGGMCAGSLLFSRFLNGRAHPFKIYACLELGTAACGLVLLLGLPLVNQLYEMVGGGTLTIRSLVAAICLLPPTVLMGATLPAIAAWVEPTAAGVAWIGRFYAANIFGAVAGSLAAGFYLLRVYDAAVATYVAIGMNVLAGIGALVIAPHVRPAPSAASSAGSFEATAAEAAPRFRTTAVHVGVAASGLTALASQVLWTRLLSLLFGGSVYAFSIILSAFLFGLGVGTTAGSNLARRVRNPTHAFAITQVLLSIAMWWAASRMLGTLPYWPVNPQLAATEPQFTMELDLVRCLWAILPATVLWGASFPLALTAVAQRGRAHTRAVVSVYAANTAGSIAGALAFGAGLVVWLGTQAAIQILIMFSASVGLLLFAAGFDGSLRPRWRIGMAASFATIAAAAAWLYVFVPSLPALLVQYGRYAAFTQHWAGRSHAIYVAEGLNGPVAVSTNDRGYRYYHNAGKVQASTEPQDLRLQRMLGHLTHLLATSPSKVLVIGLGTGITAGAVADSPLVSQLTVAEIEPAVGPVAARFFATENHQLDRNPKVRLQIEDGRHFLHTTRETFDAITLDPFDPWAKGSAVLSTREFFELTKRHLNPGGVVSLWLPLYENTPEAAKSAIATFFEAFPNGTVWGNTTNGQGYDVVLLGKLDPTPIDVDFLQVKLDNPRFVRVKQSLREIGFTTGTSLLATYAGSQADLGPWLQGAAINIDRNLKLQYLAGFGLNRFDSASIYADMVQDVRFPHHLFSGSAATLESLQQTMERALDTAKEPAG